MKKSLLTAVSILLLAFTTTLVNAQTVNSPNDAAYIRDNYTKYEYQVPMRDGKKLFTSVYVPKDQSKKYPFMMDRTPYSVEPYGAAYKGALGPSTDRKRVVE